MKKFFQTIGMISLICLSFIYTEKTVNVVKEVDSIMIEIKKENSKYKEEPVDAIIDSNTIIPGLNGKSINENKSYANMKRVGNYNPNLLEYQTVNPQKSIKKIYDKYVISGNSKKSMVSLIFIVKNNDNIDNILSILSSKNVKANFFIDSIWMENNNDKLTQLINSGHNVGNLSYNMDYTHSDFIWMDTIIKKIGKQKIGYCYSNENNDEALKICAIHKNYTIRPSIITSNHPSTEVKEAIKSGSIISFPINTVVNQQLSTIINYINSKGYKIDTLTNLLSEEK
jgi:peptidoglycan/xylan/chitin deacetylase (PgdA/CDA1 family)